MHTHAMHSCITVSHMLSSHIHTHSLIHYLTGTLIHIHILTNLHTTLNTYTLMPPTIKCKHFPIHSNTYIHNSHLYHAYTHFHTLVPLKCSCTHSHSHKSLSHIHTLSHTHTFSYRYALQHRMLTCTQHTYSLHTCSHTLTQKHGTLSHHTLYLPSTPSSFAAISMFKVET